jgi:hypothetical protein
MSSAFAAALHCRPKRLKPEQQIGPLGLQYDGTKNFVAVQHAATPELTSIPPSLICAVTKLK